jgi:D-alanyl-D-alanine carboxypeptidase (penicillin-binding protein 5/6)
LVVLLILALAFPPLPARAQQEAPVVEARAWVLYDDTYGYEIASHRADVRLPMASTTKMMTALLVEEATDPNEVVVISRRAAATGHRQIGVRRGERWLVEELLEALMVVSANDAAVALAEHVSGDVETFVARMNDRAGELGLTETRYANPHGLDARGHHTTARDLLDLARVVMSRPRLARLAAEADATIVDLEGASSDWESTNELLDQYIGAIGVKTGWTTRSGEVLVAAAERGERRLYAVVLGADDANLAATALLDHGFAVFGSDERRLVPLMDVPRHADLIRQTLPSSVVARLAHLRGLAKRAEAPWE